MNLSGFEAMAEREPSWPAAGSSIERCLEPADVEELSSLLARASESATGVLIVGGGTRIECANRAERIEIGVSTLGLEGVDVFEPDEGVLHARAGTRVESVRRIVSEAGWELPLDPPGRTSTVGGAIASASIGPRAHGFGRVADAILGLEAVSADGIPTKCGGRVVKNVTGYDLAKLYCGSWGTLGVLTGAWLRLRPLPHRCLALRAPLATDPAGFEACRQLARLTSVRALLWVEGEGPLGEAGIYFELGGSEAETAHDLATIRSALAVSEVDSARIDALRDGRALALAKAEAGIGTERVGEPVATRARVLPKDGEWLVESLRSRGFALSADPGLGIVHARGAVDSLEALLEMRASVVARGGLMTFERLPDAWRGRCDVFGIEPATADLAAEIKRRFDPANVLNPGRLQRDPSILSNPGRFQPEARDAVRSPTPAAREAGR